MKPSKKRSAPGTAIEVPPYPKGISLRLSFSDYGPTDACEQSAYFSTNMRTFGQLHTQFPNLMRSLFAE